MTHTSAEETPESLLRDWLAEQRRRLQGATQLPGDVSIRCYYRVHFADGDTAILAAYPPALLPACGRFLKTTELLQAASVRVPAVLAADCDKGWMLLEDLGDLTLFQISNRGWQELSAYIDEAREMCRRIQEIPAARVSALNPPLGLEILRREMAATWSSFLEPHGLCGSGSLRSALEQALDFICGELAASPSVPCHRDFMARNLVPVDAPPRLAVLDHQDLRMGPVTYDLAALLNDSLYPPATIHDRLISEALPDDILRQSYHRAAAQRTLKAVGTFATFAARGNRRHMALVGPTLERALSHLHKLPETADLAPSLARLWEPAVAQGI